MSAAKADALASVAKAPTAIASFLIYPSPKIFDRDEKLRSV
jgi:hypothetical protein